jgi:hypothetical protein
VSQRDGTDAAGADAGSSAAADSADPDARSREDAEAGAGGTDGAASPDLGTDDATLGGTGAQDGGSTATGSAGGAAVTGPETDGTTGTGGDVSAWNPAAGGQGTDAAAAGSEPAPVPEGYQLHQDPTGFSVAVPAGWTVEREGPRVYFHDPASRAYLLVDQTDEPQPDPVADWQRQEPRVAQRMENYERLGEIGPVEYRGWQAADWEFVFGPGQGTHVLNRNLVTSPDQAYALYWSVPSSQWDQLLPVHEQVLATFQPAG